jgi:hypothetical protein
MLLVIGGDYIVITYLLVPTAAQDGELRGLDITTGMSLPIPT